MVQIYGIVKYWPRMDDISGDRMKAILNDSWQRRKKEKKWVGFISAVDLVRAATAVSTLHLSTTLFNLHYLEFHLSKINRNHILFIIPK
jgi:hypothetical protein